MNDYKFTPEQLHEYDECVKLVNAGETLTAQQDSFLVCYSTKVKPVPIKAVKNHLCQELNIL